MRSLFGSAALALIMATPAAAQAVDTAAQSQAATPNSAPAVEEVIVTARKQSERLRDIPATISAVTAAQLQATGPVNGTGDLLRTRRPLQRS